MTISLTPELDRVLNEKLASGKYGSVEELLTAAFRALNEEEETIAAIAEGNADFEAGRYEDWETSMQNFEKT
jgi:putative addiction module CopG family antidote